MGGILTRHSWAVALAVLAIGWFGHTPGAMAQRAQCQALAAQTVQAINRARARRCNVSSARPFNVWFNNCMRAGVADAARRRNQWINFSNSCRPAGGGAGNAGQCRAIANQTVQAINRARARRCNVSSARPFAT